MVEDRYDYVQILGRVRLDDNQEAAQAQMARMAAENLIAGVTGQPLPTAVLPR